MPAYLISDVVVRDPKAFEEYRDRAAASITVHRGRYLARGGALDVFEGERNPKTIVIVEFPDMDAARRWYDSPEYAEALRFRDDALIRNLVLVDGI